MVRYDFVKRGLEVCCVDGSGEYIGNISKPFVLDLVEKNIANSFLIHAYGICKTQIKEIVNWINVAGNQTNKKVYARQIPNKHKGVLCYEIRVEV